MFAKLLKYEFRSSKSILGLLTIVVLGVFLLATLAIKAIVVGAQSDTDLAAIGIVAAVPTLGLAFFAIFAYAVAAEILLVVQFYKNKFTDEGYLTFTVPTDVHKIYLSSLVNMLIWNVIIAVTIVVGVGIFVLFGTSPDQFVNTELFKLEIPDYLVEGMVEEFGFTALDSVLFVLRGIITTISGLVLDTTCITIGATLTRKHKALAAVGVYFAATTIISILTSVIAFAITISSAMVDPSMSTVMDLSSALETALSLIVLVGGYLISTHMMKKKLNLA